MKVPFSIYDFFGYLSSGYLILAALDIASGGAWLAKKEIPPLVLVLSLIVAYVVGHIAAHFAGGLLERGLVGRYLGASEEVLFGKHDAGRLKKAAFSGYYRPLPRETQQRVLRRAKEWAGIKVVGRGLFFHCHPLVLRIPIVAERLGTFLNIYGFCRNIAASLLLTSLILGLALVNGMPTLISSIPMGNGFMLVTAPMLAAIFMIYRYLTFYRNYTAEVLRAYAEAPEDIRNTIG